MILALMGKQFTCNFTHVFKMLCFNMNFKTDLSSGRVCLQAHVFELPIISQGWGVNLSTPIYALEW